MRWKKPEWVLWYITGFLLIVFLLVLARESILRTAGSFLVLQDELKKADVIVVLAGDNERVKQGVALYKAGFSKYIIMSGGSTTSEVSSAEKMKEQVLRLGVPEDVVILEPKTKHTHNHPIFVKPILVKEGFKSAIVVSSPYHMRRASLSFNRTFRLVG